MVYVTCAGRRLAAEDIDPAVEMFAELLYDSSEVQSEGGEPCTSVGDFIRSEVHYPLLRLSGISPMFLVKILQE